MKERPISEWKLIEVDHPLRVLFLHIEKKYGKEVLEDILAKYHEANNFYHRYLTRKRDLIRLQLTEESIQRGVMVQRNELIKTRLIHSLKGWIANREVV